MKKTVILIALGSFMLMLNGCVTRTYTDAPQKRGARSQNGKEYGSSSGGNVKSQQRVWIWQDEYRK